MSKDPIGGSVSSNHVGVNQKFGSRSERMLIVLGVWVCLLPIAFILAYFFGLPAGGLAAVMSLGVAVVLCYAMCDWRLLSRQ